MGAFDFDRRIFDELIPLPDGTSYNAYLVTGSTKTALIDTVDPTKEYDLLSNLVKLGTERIDYIVINHAEQDHSGTLPMILEFYPDARVVTNAKCRDLLVALLHIPQERFLIITDGETLSLGNRTLRFFITPWTHWPETQITFLVEDKILFPCDLFGFHAATSELFITDEAAAYRSAKRYYAEIMMPFRGSIKGYVEKVRGLSPVMIAPSHGPVNKNPQFILDAYADWVSDTVKNEVVLPYVSMHGSTAKMVEHLTGALIARGIVVKPFNLTRTDIGELASCSCRCGDGRDRNPDRPLRPSSDRRIRNVSGKRAPAQDPVCIRDRILRMGWQECRDHHKDARPCQRRADPAGHGAGRTRRGGDAGPRPAGRRNLKEA